MTKKFNIVDLMMKFSHHIDSEKVVFTRSIDDGRTLLKQLEDEINKLI